MRQPFYACLCIALVTTLGCAKSTASDARAADEAKPAAPASAPLSPAQAALAVPADAEKSATGLVFKVLKPGQGEQRPASYDEVLVHFTAYNGKGEVSDSSAKRGGPSTLAVTGVIKGWSEALTQMRVGEQRRLWSPDHLTYPGRPGPPRPPAVFDLELLAIIPGEPPPPAPADVAAAPADAIKLTSGVAYKRLETRQGQQRPNAWDHVTLRYAGWTRAGVSIGSTPLERPARFAIGDVIPGWRELLPQLAVGERARVWIPEALAYQGRAGEPPGDVVFELELVSIERKPEPPRAPAQLAAPPANALKTPSGLGFLLLKHGKGRTKPTRSDRVEVHYSAWTSDGALFDSSVTRGHPASVPLNRLIAGWAEGLERMVEGDKALLWIPEPLAYAGRDGSPRGNLVYEVELLKIAP